MKNYNPSYVDTTGLHKAVRELHSLENVKCEIKNVEKGLEDLKEFEDMKIYFEAIHHMAEIGRIMNERPDLFEDVSDEDKQNINAFLEEAKDIPGAYGWKAENVKERIKK